MTTTDPRSRLDEIKARLSKLDDVNTAGIGLQMSAHYAVDTMLREDLPAMAAALTEILNLENEPLPSGSEGDDWYGAGWNDALFNMKSRITEALGGAQPAQSERH